MVGRKRKTTGSTKEVVAKKKVAVKKKVDVKKLKKQYRCTLKPTAQIINDLRPQITEAHISAMKKTPFYGLFNLFYQGWIEVGGNQKISVALLQILDTYREYHDGFNIGETFMKITAEDVAVILGMRMKGKEMNAFPKIGSIDYSLDPFCIDYFEKKRTITKDRIDKHLKRIVAIPGKELDFVKLIILHMASNFLFTTQAGGCISISFTLLLRDLDTINRVSWPKTILSYMKKMVKKNMENPINASGAIILLPIWLGEHSNIQGCIRGAEKRTPRLGRWNLQDLAENIRVGMGMLREQDISLEFRDPLLEEERLLLEDGEEEETIEQERKRKEYEEKLKELLEENDRLKEENLRLKELVEAKEYMNIIEGEKKITDEDRKGARKILEKASKEKEELKYSLYQLCCATQADVPVEPLEENKERDNKKMIGEWDFEMVVRTEQPTDDNLPKQSKVSRNKKKAARKSVVKG